MAAVKLGSNAGILANRAALDLAVGQKIAALKKAIREARDLKLLVDQVANSDLVAMSYGDGTGGTADEIGYLRTALSDAEELYKIFNATATARTLPYDFDSAMKYVAAVT
jgi:hypothetical protein